VISFVSCNELLGPTLLEALCRDPFEEKAKGA
jgi:hypothetical protein